MSEAFGNEALRARRRFVFIGGKRPALAWGLVNNPDRASVSKMTTEVEATLLQTVRACAEMAKNPSLAPTLLLGLHATLYQWDWKAFTRPLRLGSRGGLARRRRRRPRPGPRSGRAGTRWLPRPPVPARRLRLFFLLLTISFARGSKGGFLRKLGCFMSRP